MSNYFHMRPFSFCQCLLVFVWMHGKTSYTSGGGMTFVCLKCWQYQIHYELMELNALLDFLTFMWVGIFYVVCHCWVLKSNFFLFDYKKKFKLLSWCLFDRHCPFVMEAITALAELGSTAKDIISLFPQVCW